MRRFIPLVLIACGIWAYHTSFRGPFLLDDVGNILENSTIRRLWPIWRALSPSPSSLVGGRPIVNLSLAVNYALGGMDVWGYHAFNLAVHVMAGLTLYGIVRRTLLRPGLRDRFGATSEWVALTVAVIWMVHPLQTEAVTYISQRCESLMGLFYLLTLYGFIRGVESRTTLGWFSLSVAACFLGMASKEVMVTAPVMVLLYDRTFVSGGFRQAWNRHRRLYFALGSSWLLLGYLMAGLHNRSVGYGLGSTWWGYALAECRAVVQYLRLAFWPQPLIFDYGAYVSTGQVASVALYALLLVILVIAVLLELKRRPGVGFLGAWFFVILAPTSSVVPIVGSPMAEHRMYLPLAAVVTLTVIGAFEIGKSLCSERRCIGLGCVAGGGLVMLLTLLTIQRNRDYTSELSLWQDTVAKRPNNPRAHNCFGLALLAQGRLLEAVGEYEQALRIQPDYAEAHNNLGIALIAQGQAQGAISHWEQALHLKPDFAEAHCNLGKELLRTGNIQDAIGHYQQAVQSKPDLAQAHNGLGDALMGQGRLPEAMDQWEQTVRIQPDYAEPHNGLGIALGQLGRLPEAIVEYEQALRIQPRYAEAHNNLALALAQQGRLQEAVTHWEQALEINPDYAEAHNNLATALVQLGRVPEAIGQYEQALRIKPDYADARNNLSRVRPVQ